MTFAEAFALIEQGETVRRPDWEMGITLMEDDELALLSYEDVIANDWMLVPKLLTFQDAWKAYMDGNPIRRVGWDPLIVFLPEYNASLCKEDINACDWIVL